MHSLSHVHVLVNELHVLSQFTWKWLYKSKYVKNIGNCAFTESFIMPIPTQVPCAMLVARETTHSMYPGKQLKSLHNKVTVYYMQLKT